MAYLVPETPGCKFYSLGWWIKEIFHHETCVCFTISYPSNDWLLMLGSQGLGWTKQNNFVPACSRFGVVTFSTQLKGCLMAPVSSPPIWTVVCGTRFQPQNFLMAGQSIPPLPPPPKKEALIAGLISLSTETKRSCLGGFGGAAGSDTSWYDFCHDQSKLACHKMTSIFNAATHRPLASASSWMF